MCFAIVVIAAWSLTQEVTGSSPFNDKYFLSLNPIKSFSKKSIEIVPKFLYVFFLTANCDWSDLDIDLLAGIDPFCNQLSSCPVNSVLHYL